MFFSGIFYPIKFGIFSSSRHRQMIFSYVILGILIALAVFSNLWLTYFSQWIQFEQVNAPETPDITFGSWLFLLEIMRFVLLLLVIGLNGAYVWYGYLVYRMQIDRQEKASLAIRLLLGQTTCGLMIEELSFVLIGQCLLTGVATLVGHWVFQRAQNDFDTFFVKPAGFDFLNNNVLLFGVRLFFLCVLLILFALGLYQYIQQEQTGSHA